MLSKEEYIKKLDLELAYLKYKRELVKQAKAESLKYQILVYPKIPISL